MPKSNALYLIGLRIMPEFVGVGDSYAFDVRTLRKLELGFQMPW